MLSLNLYCNNITIECGVKYIVYLKSIHLSAFWGGLIKVTFTTW